MDDNNTVKYGSFFEIGIGLIVLALIIGAWKFF